MRRRLDAPRRPPRDAPLLDPARDQHARGLSLQRHGRHPHGQHAVAVAEYDVGEEAVADEDHVRGGAAVGLGLGFLSWGWGYWEEGLGLGFVSWGWGYWGQVAALGEACYQQGDTEASHSARPRPLVRTQSGSPVHRSCPPASCPYAASSGCRMLTRGLPLPHLVVAVCFGDKGISPLLRKHCRSSTPTPPHLGHPRPDPSATHPRTRRHSITHPQGHTAPAPPSCYR